MQSAASCSQFFVVVRANLSTLAICFWSKGLAAGARRILKTTARTLAMFCLQLSVMDQSKGGKAIGEYDHTLHVVIDHEPFVIDNGSGSASVFMIGTHIGFVLPIHCLLLRLALLAHNPAKRVGLQLTVAQMSVHTFLRPGLLGTHLRFQLRAVW